MCGVGKGEVVGDRWVPDRVLDVRSLDGVLDELPVAELLAVEPPVVEDMAFCVLPVGVTSKLSV